MSVSTVRMTRGVDRYGSGWFRLVRGSLEVPGSSFVQADSVVRGGSEWFSCSGLIGMVRWYGLIRGGSRWLGLEMNLNLE